MPNTAYIRSQFSQASPPPGHSPAVHYDRPSVRDAPLGPVDLIQEAKDSPWLIGDPVIWPAEILEVLDLPGALFLQHWRGGGDSFVRLNAYAALSSADQGRETQICLV